MTGQLRWLVGWTAMAAGLAWAGQQPGADRADPSLLELLTSTAPGHQVSPWLELTKLVVAAIVGQIVTSVHKHYQRERAPSRSLLQAEVLLCVSGALMMIIIGNSTARALGIAGGASIIRFRTPVEDPRDTILLFLLLGLGMAAGLGSFAVCGLGTLFLCLVLVVLDKLGDQKPRTILLEVVASSSEFPTEHVCRILGMETESFEPVKVSQTAEASVKYSLKMAHSTSLHYLSGRLMDGGKAGIKSISWEQPKKQAD